MHGSADMDITNMDIRSKTKTSIILYGYSAGGGSYPVAEVASNYSQLLLPLFSNIYRRTIS